MTKPKRRKRFYIFLTVGIVLLALILSIFSKKKDQAVVVQTEKVARRNLIETVVANGNIYPVVQLHISAEVSGEIIELAVKEGQKVKKGDLLLKIKPDYYVAALNQAKAGYESSLNSKTTAQANLEKAEAEFNRNKELFDRKLISDSEFIGFKTSRDIAVAQLENAKNQVDMAKASQASVQDSLNKTTIVSPRDGTITKLNSQLGERVLGTVQNAGTDIMTISDLSDMEARVDIGEMDVVLIKRGEKAQLDVDAYKDRKFTGTVTQIANSSKNISATSQSQDATKFEVRIRFDEIEAFRPGMSVNAHIETRYRTNVLTVPFGAVTTRPPGTHSISSAGVQTNTNSLGSDQKSKDALKADEVVFAVNGTHAKMVKVKTGIYDDNYWEITDGLAEGQEIISGGPKAVSKDLQDGKEIRKDAVLPGEPSKK